MNRATEPLLGNADPPSFEVLRPEGRSPFVLTCDHASARIPNALGDLGLPEGERLRQIAWDIGSAGVTRALSEDLDAPAVLSGYSRLVIDCNRPFEHHTSITLKSEDTEIPGNANLGAGDRQRRQRELFHPYHDAIRKILDARESAGQRSVLVAMHSFTPAFHGEARAWDVAVLYQRDRRFSATLLDQLHDQPGLCVGDNEPYQVTDDHDYGIPVHGEQRGLLHALVEVRQDHIASADGQRKWGERLAALLPKALAALEEQDG